MRIPAGPDHPFRSDPIICFGRTRSLISADPIARFGGPDRWFRPDPLWLRPDVRHRKVAARSCPRGWAAARQCATRLAMSERHSCARFAKFCVSDSSAGGRTVRWRRRAASVETLVLKRVRAREDSSTGDSAAPVEKWKTAPPGLAKTITSSHPAVSHFPTGAWKTLRVFHSAPSAGDDDFLLPQIREAGRAAVSAPP